MPVDLPDLSPTIRLLADRCAVAGGRALLVGGAVRDWLMGRPVKDWDIEVHGLSEPDLERLLRKIGPVNAVGRSFGVFKLRDGEGELDVSLPRTDSKVGPGHRGIQVNGDPFLGIREAARRRDLTVNAILLDPLTGERIDPFQGQEDLASGILRAVDADTFLEDPLRALRVVQFTARLEMTPTDALLDLCRDARLDELPAERVEGEWRKLLLVARRPSLGLAVARKAAILARVFPEAAAADVPAVDTAVDRVASRDLAPIGRRYATLLAAWLHAAPPDAVEVTLDRLGLHTLGGYPMRERIRAAVACWREAPADDAALRHLSTRTELEPTLTVRWAVTGDDAVLGRLARARALGIANEPPPRLLLGRHLAAIGVPAGPHMGKLLAWVYARQLDGAVTTLDEAVAEATRRWSSDRP